MIRPFTIKCMRILHSNIPEIALRLERKLLQPRVNQDSMPSVKEYILNSTAAESDSPPTIFDHPLYDPEEEDWVIVQRFPSVKAGNWTMLKVTALGD